MIWWNGFMGWAWWTDDAVELEGVKSHALKIFVALWTFKFQPPLLLYCHNFLWRNCIIHDYYYFLLHLQFHYKSSIMSSYAMQKSSLFAIFCYGFPHKNILLIPIHTPLHGTEAVCLWQWYGFVYELFDRYWNTNLIYFYNINKFEQIHDYENIKGESPTWSMHFFFSRFWRHLCPSQGPNSEDNKSFNIKFTRGPVTFE